MQTITNINAVFDQIVESHKQLRSRHKHSFDELDIDKVNVDQYPLLYAQVTGSTISAQEVEYEFEVVVATIVMEDQTPTYNDVYNETHLILQDVIAHLHTSASYLAESERFTLEMPVNADPFASRFSNMLGGWSCTLSIRVPLPVNLCDAPYE